MLTFCNYPSCPSNEKHVRDNARGAVLAWRVAPTQAHHRGQQVSCPQAGQVWASVGAWVSGGESRRNRAGGGQVALWAG